MRLGFKLCPKGNSGKGLFQYQLYSLWLGQYELTFQDEYELDYMCCLLVSSWFMDTFPPEEKE